MPRIGVTGHVLLDDVTPGLLLAALTGALREYTGPGRLPPHGITCLAPGTDQLFAEAVVALGGTFEVVLPACDYAEQVAAWQDRAAFDKLLSQATKVDVMPFARSGRQAYRAASEEMLDRCDLLFAVWDGQPSAQVGDTAHVVAVARGRGLPVRVLWPAGAARR